MLLSKPSKSLRPIIKLTVCVSRHLLSRARPPSIYISSLPFSAEEGEEGGGDAARGGPSHPGPGKGLSREQRDGLGMVKEVMNCLDEEDGLDQIYTFRLDGAH